MAVVIVEVIGCVEPDSGPARSAPPRAEGGPEPREPEPERVRRIVRRMERRQMRLRAD